MMGVPTAIGRTSGHLSMANPAAGAALLTALLPQQPLVKEILSTPEENIFRKIREERMILEHVGNWRISVEEGPMRVEAFIYFDFSICKKYMYM